MPGPETLRHVTGVGCWKTYHSHANDAALTQSAIPAALNSLLLENAFRIGNSQRLDGPNAALTGGASTVYARCSSRCAIRWRARFDAVQGPPKWSQRPDDVTGLCSAACPPRRAPPPTPEAAEHPRTLPRRADRNRHPRLRRK